MRDMEGGGERRIHARSLIAADGVRSTVRSALGIAASRSQELEARLSVLFRAPLWELVGDRRHAIYFITAAAMLLCSCRRAFRIAGCSRRSGISIPRTSRAWITPT